MRIEEEVERWNRGTWQRLTIRYESRGIQSEKGGSINILNHSILNRVGYEDRHREGRVSHAIDRRMRIDRRTISVGATRGEKCCGGCLTSVPVGAEGPCNLGHG